MDKTVDHPSVYYTSNFYRYFRMFKPVNRAEHGKGAYELNKLLEFEVKNCYTPSGNGCFLKCIKHIFKKRIYQRSFRAHTII